MISANAKKVRTLHAGRSPGSRTKFRILGNHGLVRVGKIKVSKTVDDIQGVLRYRVWIRVIFAKIISNKGLVVSMTAAINR